MATQSVASLAALSDFLNFGKEHKSLLEKFLYAAAFSPRPSGELLRLVLVSMDVPLPPRVWDGSSPHFSQEGTASVIFLKKENMFL